MSDLTERMEQMSLAYIQACAAGVGLIASRPAADIDSVDLTISTRNEPDFPIRPKLDIQVKSTSSIDDVEDVIKYDLKLKNYNELRENTMVPRILVLVLLPKDVIDWCTHSAQELVLRRCGYWMSLQGQPATSNTTSVRLEIPSKNLFGPSELREILKESQNS